MSKEFVQHVWDESIEAECRHLARVAVAEDLAQWQDWTTIALIPEFLDGSAQIVSRESGVVCGIRTAETLLDEMDANIAMDVLISDGDLVRPKDVIATLKGNVRDLLTCERPLLNFMGRLSGIATLTRRFVDAIEGTHARIYDTRKTLPGWRLLEKYAVHCGGGMNHRTGLYDAILIKDNHLAFFKTGMETPSPDVPFLAVQQAKQFAEHLATVGPFPSLIVEIEVDSLAQLESTLAAKPDIVLLDNMTCEVLSKAVALRDRLAPEVELEASGGITLSTVRGVAETGVERISSGSLTHSAVNFDVGLDWI